MQRYFETVFDTLTGAAIKGAEVWLFNASDNSVATIYTDGAGTSPVNQPLISDSNGYVECFPPDGVYNIEFRVAGYTLRTILGVAIFDLAAIAAVAGDVYTKGQIDALIPTATSLANYYTKAQVDAALAGAAVTQHYHYGSFAVTGIQSNEILMDHQAAVAHTLADDFADNVASVGANPTANPWVATVQVNGAAVGTLSITSAGVRTWSTTGGAVAVAKGDVVTVVGPAAADATIGRLRFTFRGTI